MALLWLGGCGCFESECLSSARIDFTRAESFEAGKYTLRVESGGGFATLECEPTTTCASCLVQETKGIDLHFACMGHRELDLILHGTPNSVRVLLTREGTVAADATVALDYAQSEEDCSGKECRHASTNGSL